MVPHPARQVELEGRLFVVEKMGLDMYFLGGVQIDDPDRDLDDDNDDNDD